MILIEKPPGSRQKGNFLCHSAPTALVMLDGASIPLPSLLMQSRENPFTISTHAIAWGGALKETLEFLTQSQACVSHARKCRIKCHYVAKTLVCWYVLSDSNKSGNYICHVSLTYFVPCIPTGCGGALGLQSTGGAFVPGEDEIRRFLTC